MATVSIIILNYNHPEVIRVCLESLQKTQGVDYEVVVVDNGSEPHVVKELQDFQSYGWIDKLVLETTNHMFSEGNNIGVRNANPDSEYVLLLNSDVGIIHPEWLTKLLGWMDGTIPHSPCVWNFHPTVPRDEPRDIVSCGWSYDPSVLPAMCRPEGWCCLIRKTLWQDMSTDFPWLYGFEEMMGKIIRAGAKCGVLWHYQPYVMHREGASEASKISAQIHNTRVPDIATWLGGLDIETLDFTLGPPEHDSYLDW